MSREAKLQYHLEEIIWESLPEGTRLNARQMKILVGMATPEQHEAAYVRALTRCPMLLDDERSPR